MSSSTFATRCVGRHARDLLERIHALHRDQHGRRARPGGCACCDEVGEIGEGARDRRRRSAARDSSPRRDRTRPRRWSSPSSVFAWRRNAHFLWLESSNVTRIAGRAMAIGMPGQSGAGTDVERALPPVAQVRQHREAIEHVQRHHLRGIAHRGEVVHAVPLREEVQVGGRASRPRRRAGRAPSPRFPRGLLGEASCVLLRRDRARQARGASDARAGARSPPASHPGCARPDPRSRAGAGRASGATSFDRPRTLA